MITLDDTDRKILRTLQVDGGVSTMALAEVVGASQSSCWRKLRSLEENGAIGHAVRPVDARVIGLTVNVICNVRLKDHLPDSRNSFLRFVAAQDMVLECFAMSGDWDYLLRVIADSVESYQIFLMRGLLVYPAVASASSHFVLSVDKFTTALPI
jgi:DNA-binding Lrp family transcriptional regulator